MSYARSPSGYRNAFELFKPLGLLDEIRQNICINNKDIRVEGVPLSYSSGRFEEVSGVPIYENK